MKPGNAPHSLIPFPEFLNNFKTKTHQVYSNLNYNELEKYTRGIPAAVFEKIMPLSPLSVIIPSEFGGRGGHVNESLLVIAAAAYESLAFSLILGINSALFLHPVIKYANHEVKKNIFNGFLHDKKMGGLMITEPDHGSDALNMNSYFTSEKDQYNIQGTKHWAGLTGFANYWLLTAREKDKTGNLKRDIDFFICDTSQPGQQIIVEELYDNLGLHQIPYGKNKIDVTIPVMQRLEPKTTGINLMLDTLHRSRLQFPAMGIGFIQRMLDEAIDHCKKRFVGGKSLLHYDQVQSRLSKLQASFTVCSAMCSYSSEHAGIEHDLTTRGIEANSFKALASDLMQQAAQSLVQLVGAKAYRYSHIAGRGIIDSRPFQIFEGSNDILYAQIAENIIKLMKQKNELNTYEFLKKYWLTTQAVSHIKKLLDFNLNLPLTQRKLVEFGQIISHIIAIEMVLKLKENKFRDDLINNAVSVLINEIYSLTGKFVHQDNTNLIVDYIENSSWTQV